MHCNYDDDVTCCDDAGVIVGHPYMLMSDEYWREMLIYAYDNKAYTGADCSLLTKRSQRRSKVIAAAAVASRSSKRDSGDKMKGRRKGGLRLINICMKRRESK